MVGTVPRALMVTITLKDFASSASETGSHSALDRSRHNDCGAPPLAHSTAGRCLWDKCRWPPRLMTCFHRFSDESHHRVYRRSESSSRQSSRPCWSCHKSRGQSLLRSRRWPQHGSYHSLRILRAGDRVSCLLFGGRRTCAASGADRGNRLPLFRLHSVWVWSEASPLLQDHARA